MIKRIVFWFLFLVLLINPVYAEEWGWQNSVVVAGTVTDSSISVSSSTVGIAYIDGGDLYFVKSSNRGYSWSSPVSIATGVSTCSFKMASTTRMYIAYYASATGDAKLAKSINGGTTWTISTIESTNDIGQYIEIALVANTVLTDRLDVAYYDVTNTGLRLSTSSDSGATWTPQAVDTTDDVGKALSIDSYYSSLGMVYLIGISYYDATNNTIEMSYSNDSGATWTTSTIAIVSATETISSVQLYPGTSSVDVIYQNASGHLDFSTSVTGTTPWTTITVDRNAGAAGDSNTLVVTDYNNVRKTIYALYIDRINALLKIAKSIDNGVTWNIEFADTTIWSAPITAVVVITPAGLSSGIDSNRNLYLSYFDILGDLKFTRTISFSEAPSTVGSVSGLSIMKSPRSWTVMKDGSVGDNLDFGVAAVSIYEWDGEKFQRKRSPSGKQFYSVKRANIAASSINVSFGFKAKKIAVFTPTANTDEICIDWTGGTAVCPAANTAGDDRIPAATSVILDEYGVTSISVIAASGTQTIYIRAWE